ncbi:FeoB-associated Cys-rich membrane protein [Tamlana crocina]|nr:FeoB-associated Cys-rich membrane protein [Tamlana crocina]
MNTIIQNTLVIAAVGFAIIFLVKKFFWKKPKKKRPAEATAIVAAIN